MQMLQVCSSVFRVKVIANCIYALHVSGANNEKISFCVRAPTSGRQIPFLIVILIIWKCKSNKFNVTHYLFVWATAVPCNRQHELQMPLRQHWTDQQHSSINWLRHTILACVWLYNLMWPEYGWIWNREGRGQPVLSREMWPSGLLNV